MSRFSRRTRAYDDVVWQMLFAYLLISAAPIRAQENFNNNGTGTARPCFFLNGLESSGGACFPNQPNSACCGPGFVCLSSGLCETGPDLTKTYKYKYYRSSCTDPTWKAPECPNFCVGTKDAADAGQGVQSCAGTGSTSSYCCGRGFDCCQNSSLIFNLEFASIVTTLPLKWGDATSSTSATTSPTASPASSNSGSTNSVAIGVGVGIGIAGLALIVAAVVFLLRRRKQKRPAELEARDHAPSPSGPAYPMTRIKPLERRPSELDAFKDIPHELEHNQRYEMGNDNYKEDDSASDKKMMPAYEEQTLQEERPRQRGPVYEMG